MKTSRHTEARIAFAPYDIAGGRGMRRRRLSGLSRYWASAVFTDDAARSRIAKY
ncbi:hypothetical protein PMO31116_04171 [Pandoraea morbifera]|uniref:Uncharacterized protein n=1 Tax=Pandoraea morbifera TaxID=2508300 RepID=A0A5E4Y0S7_9BURK|nr:hypothetical protein PMO31116_04171 [Pandoraea morbifera]